MYLLLLFEDLSTTQKAPFSFEPAGSFWIGYFCSQIVVLMDPTLAAKVNPILVLAIILISSLSVFYVFIAELKVKRDPIWPSIFWIGLSFLLPVLVPLIYIFRKKTKNDQSQP